MSDLKRYVVQSFDSFKDMEDFINQQTTTYRPVSITDTAWRCAVLLERRDS